jgi:hypothetical protein
MAYEFFVQDARGLSNEAIMYAAPSVFAEAAHESRSSRYTYIPTSYVLEGLREVGFVPTTAMQSRSRVEGRQAFTKHLLRLRHANDLGYSLPDVHEIVLVNSHDGTSAYNLYSGVFRLVCTNGLIRGDFSDTMKVRHTGNVVEEVVESTLSIAEMSEQVMQDVEEMKCIELSRPEQLLLAEFGLKARFDLDEEEDEGERMEKKVVPYQPQDLLRVRRREDARPDLYTTLNVVQENAMKGGVRGSLRDSRGQRRRIREVHGIDQSVRVNRLLWQFAERLKEFKQNYG